MKYALHLISALFAAALCSCATAPAPAPAAQNVAFDAARGQIVFNSFIDPNWQKWQERPYSYGLKTGKVEVPLFFDAPINTASTISVRGGDLHKKRWGLHLFEGYAADDKSRITMLVNKHVEEGYPVGEFYYFGTAYNQTDAMPYYWMRIGSDVPYHSYMFSRDRAIFYGSVDMRWLLTLPNISSSDLRDTPVSKAEADKIRAAARAKLKREDFETDSYYKHAVEGEFYKEFAKYTRRKEFKNVKDGTIFYDSDRKIVVIKIGGKWHKLSAEPLDVEYDK